MIKHERHRGCGDEILDRGDHRQIGVHLDMPVAVLDALDASLKALPSDVWIVGAAGCEIEPDAANARLVHGVQITLRRLVVDHDDAARGRAARLHAEQRRGIVGTINARCHDHDALDA